MNIDLEIIKLSDKEKLENLMQLYLHDLNIYFNIPFNSNTCKYDYDLSKYFEDNYAYFIKEDNDILGFILIDDNKDNNYEISEIFVLNNYKNKKIGELATNKIFDMYKGNWIIKAVPNSVVAESFWNKTINNYTKGDYLLEHIGKYNRAVFIFNNMM